MTKPDTLALLAEKYPAPVQVEVVVDFEGHTYTTYAATKEEGERIIHAHIDRITNPQPAE